MNTWGKFATGMAVAAMGVLALSGCTSGESSFADLRGDAEEGPALPSGVSGDALESLDEDTIRWVGTSDGTELWLGEGATPDSACLLAYPADEQWSSTCTTDASIAELGGGFGTFLLVPDSLAAPDDATAISENVYRAS